MTFIQRTKDRPRTKSQQQFDVHIFLKETILEFKKIISLIKHLTKEQSVVGLNRRPRMKKIAL